MKAYFVSLGCPKNLTDTEVLMGKLVSAGHEITTKEKDADSIVVNTCAFLESARKESLDTINKFSKTGKKIYVAGCLPKWNRNACPDSHIGVKSQVPFATIESLGLFDSKTPRVKATHPWTAYVKISEGCDNCCSYCLIPKLRGGYAARKINDILKEVETLAKRGVKEIIYIGQDTTAFPDFAKLLKETAKIEGIRWIRIMYANPKNLSDEIIKIIKEEPKIVKYLDLPIQHISDRILMLMNRAKPTGSDIAGLLDKLRISLPNISIRTSIIVGFPGETKADFKKLLAFVSGSKFEKLGVFEYSREEGTPAYNMRGQVSRREKKIRFHKLMSLQNKISRENNRNMIGKIIEVLCEGLHIGRASFDAPEIDGSVKIIGNLNPGEFGKVSVTSASAYSLTGHLVST